MKHRLAEDTLLAAEELLNTTQLTPVQRVVFTELKDQLRLCLEEVCDMSLTIGVMATDQRAVQPDHQGWVEP